MQLFKKAEKQAKKAPAEVRAVDTRAPSAAHDGEPIIRVNNVSRVYEVGESKVQALRNVSIEVPKGVLGALKGRSGSG